jgi:NAD(P)H-hydrate epimerase
MRQIEATVDASGLSYNQLMQNAGRALAERVKELLAEATNPNDASITVLVGPGNNGGDGLVAGRILAEETSALVRFYLLKPRSDDDANFQAIRAANLFIASAEDDQRYRVLTNMVASATIIIDALFGTGVQLPLRDDVAKVLRHVQQAIHETEADGESGAYTILSQPSHRHSARPYIVAVDCPSGLDCDTGEIDKNTLHADETVTFIAAKPGHFTFPGAQAVGRLTISHIGVPPTTEGLREEKRAIADAQTVRDLLPVRPTDANKGTFGKVLVIGGSINYTGAAALCAMSAYRSGAGLVTVGAPGPVIAALAAHILEATWLLLPHDMGVIASSASTLLKEELPKVDSLLIGPGMGREKTTRELLQELFMHQSTAVPSRRVIGFATAKSEASETAENNDFMLPPLVIDADGLNLLSEIDEWWTLLPEETIITPHPGEMARLAKMEIADVQANRWQIAAENAARWKVVLLLKGAHTLIAHPDGRVVVLPFKESALATAGTGDVLAGMIAGLLAQGLQPFDAALVGGYLHQLAGAEATRKAGNGRSVIAGDVLSSISDAYQLLERA